MQPVKIEDLLSYRFLSRVRISPTGEWAAFVVKQANVEKNDYRSDLYLAHLSHPLVRRLTTSGRDGPFAWEQDGTALLFISRREEPQDGCYLFRIPLDGGEAERIGKIPHKVKDLALLDDGRLLYTSRVPVGPRDEAEDAKDYEILDEIPFWQNGDGITNRRRVRLFLFDPRSEQATPLTEEELDVEDFDVRGDRIAFAARRFPGKAPARTSCGGSRSLAHRAVCRETCTRSTRCASWIGTRSSCSRATWRPTGGARTARSAR